MRSAWSLDDKVVAACVGTLSTVYDYELLLDAVGRLAARPELHVLIVGDGSRKDWLQQEVARRGLRNVTLLPARPHHEIRGVLAAADIAALALVPLPVTEGQLPVRLLEAMAMELPIVFAGAGVASQLVAESACGMAVRPGDVDGFTRILDWLVDDPDLRQRLGRAGRQTIALRFSRRAVAAKIERALLAAVERQP